jgi:hypothetical protein
VLEAYKGRDKFVLVGTLEDLASCAWSWAQDLRDAEGWGNPPPEEDAAEPYQPMPAAEAS